MVRLLIALTAVMALTFSCDNSHSSDSHYGSLHADSRQGRYHVIASFPGGARQAGYNRLRVELAGISGAAKLVIKPWMTAMNHGSPKGSFTTPANTAEISIEVK